MIIEVEQDHTIYGDEVKFGGGKVIRDGMGQSQRGARDSVDTVTTSQNLARRADEWPGKSPILDRDFACLTAQAQLYFVLSTKQGV